MKKSLKHLKKYKKEVFLGPLFKLVEASFELLIPLVVAHIIDSGISRADVSIAVLDSVIMVLLGVLGLIFSVVAQYYCARAAVGFGADLRALLFEKIQTLSYSQIDAYTTSTLITRLTGDVNAVQNGVNIFLRLVLRSPFIVFGAAIMAFTVDPVSAISFVVVIPVLSLVIFGIMLLSMPLFKKVQKKVEKVLGLCEENTGGARVIRAFCAEEEEIKSFGAENRDLYSLQKKVGRLSALTNPLTFVIVNGATIALLWTGAVRVDGGFILAGSVVALFNYMSQILIELIKFANVIVSVTKAVASLDRVESILYTPQDTLPAPNDKSFPGKVCFDRVTLRYTKGAESALSDISFTVNEGETVGIIGSTGSGKTSLINLLGAYYVPESGTVSVDGRDVFAHDLSALRKKIAIVSQRSVLFSGSVRDNLVFGNEEASDDVLTDALERAQAREFVDSKGGLSAEVTQGGKNFSGGQRQRLCIARALARKAEILILDDASSALDFATDKAMRKAIRELPERPTVFIVSQRTASIMHADRIIVLEDGSIVGTGKHDDLLASCPVYREIYDSQFKKGSEV